MDKPSWLRESSPGKRYFSLTSPPSHHRRIQFLQMPLHKAAELARSAHTFPFELEDILAEFCIAHDALHCGAYELIGACLTCHMGARFCN